MRELIIQDCFKLNFCLDSFQTTQGVWRQAANWCQSRSKVISSLGRYFFLLYSTPGFQSGHLLLYLGLGLSKFTSHLALRWWYSPLVSQAQEDRDPFGMALLEWFLDCVSSAPFPVSHKKSKPSLPSSANVSKAQVSFSLLPTTPTWLPPELSASPRWPYFLAILSII